MAKSRNEGAGTVGWFPHAGAIAILLQAFPRETGLAGIDTLAHWHQLVAARDASGLDALLADDVVFHSPVVHTTQAGRARTLPYLAAAFHVFFNDSFRYVREIRGERDAMLEFSVTIDDIEVNGVDIIRWNEDGRIVDFKVMLRPLKAIHLIHEQMGAMLQQGEPRA